MASVTFTPNLRRHVDCPTVDVTGNTAREILCKVFAENPRLRSYIVDDQGGLRKHMIVFVDGLAIEDRETLSDEVQPASELFVLQALSGG